jgi:hypothetical protein
MRKVQEMCHIVTREKVPKHNSFRGIDVVNPPNVQQKEGGIFFYLVMAVIEFISDLTSY